MIRIERQSELPAAPLGRVQRSTIKPGTGLVNLTSSGERLRGVHVEFNREPSTDDMGVVVPPADQHVIVVYAGNPAVLHWKEGPRHRSSRFYPGTVIVNPAGYYAPHAWDATADLVFVAFDLDAAHLGTEPGPLRPDWDTRDPLAAELALAVANEFRAGAAADVLYADALLAALGAHLTRVYADRHTPTERAPRELHNAQLGHVLDFIDAQLGERILTADLAAVAGVSVSHFARLFREATGETPHAYVLRRRVERAATLITRTTTPFAQIATSCGFADQSHLNRVLRKALGLTPGQLRIAAH